MTQWQINPLLYPTHYILNDEVRQVAALCPEHPGVEYNASLMESAPDLLAACESFIQAVDKHGAAHYPTLEKEIEAARQVVARVEQ